jgi:hypothetical protein
VNALLGALVLSLLVVHVNGLFAALCSVHGVPASSLLYQPRWLCFLFAVLAANR